MSDLQKLTLEKIASEKLPDYGWFYISQNDFSENMSNNFQKIRSNGVKFLAAIAKAGKKGIKLTRKNILAMKCKGYYFDRDSFKNLVEIYEGKKTARIIATDYARTAKYEFIN